MLSEASPQTIKIKNQRTEIKGVSRKAAKSAKKSSGLDRQFFLRVFAALRENWV